MSKKIFLGIILMMWVVVICEPAISQVKREKVEWVPSTIKGITPGKSTYKDVIRLFGKPDYEGEAIDCGSEDLEEPSVTVIELGYKQDIKIEGVLARIGFGVYDETRIVSSISLYFKEMTKEDAIKIYSNDYYMITNSDHNNSTTREYQSLCIYKTQKRNQEVKVDKLFGYPIYLVYPQKGMHIQIRSNNKVMMVEYMDGC